MSETVAVLPCLCGTTPELDVDDCGDRKEYGYVCPKCFYDTEHYSRSKYDAKRSWNSWVRSPRNENGGISRGGYR